MKERREFVRLKTCLTVFYKESSGTPAEMISRLLDVSREGAHLSDQNSMRENAPVELKIIIPGEGTPVVASAETVWCSRTDDYFYRKGLRFTQIHKSDVKRLLNCTHYEQ